MEFPDDILVEMVRAGNDLALDALLQRYTSYARSKARTYFLIGADREDIVQEGMIGLFKAIRDFDASKTVSFRSFAELCITRQIITAIKTATRQKHHPLNSYVSLHRPVMSDDEGERQLADFLASAQIVDPVELVVAEDEVAQIRAFLAGILSDLEAEVLNLYLQGKSYQDIAVSLRRQAKSIDNALQRIKRKLEQFLEQREATAEQTAAPAQESRVVHVSRFPVIEADVRQTDVRPLVHATNGSKNGNGRTAPPVLRAVQSKATKPNGSAKKPVSKQPVRTNPRPGELRASLRFAISAATKASRTVRGKTKAPARKKSSR